MLSSVEIERELGRLEDLGLIKTLLLSLWNEPSQHSDKLCEFLPDVCHKLFWIVHFCGKRFAVCFEEKSLLRNYP